MNYWPSQHAQSVDYVMLYITSISVFLLLGITVAMIYFVIRYSRKRNPVASQIEGNHTLEIIWIVVPVLLVLTMFYFGYDVFRKSRLVPEGAVNISRSWPTCWMVIEFHTPTVLEGMPVTVYGQP